MPKIGQSSAGNVEETEIKAFPSPRRVPVKADVERGPPAMLAIGSSSRTKPASKDGGINSTTSSGEVAAAPKTVQRAVRASSRKSLATGAGAALGAATSTQPLAPVLNPAQLAALTAKHTTLNKRNYNKHNVTVIHKDEDRPPSPTSKIRKVMEGTSSPKSAGSLASSGAGSLQSIAAHDIGPSASGSRKRPHFVAAGDDSPFESPVKPGGVEVEDGPSSKRARNVKWDRALLRATSELRTPRRARAKEAELLGTKKVFKVKR